MGNRRGAIGRLMVTGKLSAAGPGPAIRIRSYRVTVQSPVVLVTLTPDAEIAFRVETTRTDPASPATVWELVCAVNEPTALASIPLPNDPAGVRIRITDYRGGELTYTVTAPGGDADHV